jgi:hypothetical protein
MRQLRVNLLGEERTTSRANNYDNAMHHAERRYKESSKRDDPYAFPKAVESLPVAVLVEILCGKATTELDSPQGTDYGKGDEDKKEWSCFED